jgi:hypothetical protein
MCSLCDKSISNEGKINAHVDDRVFEVITHKCFKFPFNRTRICNIKIFSSSECSSSCCVCNWGYCKYRVLNTSCALFFIGRCSFIYLFFILFIYSLALYPRRCSGIFYPNLTVICVPSLAEIAHLDGIFSIITSRLLGGTLPTRRLIYILLHLRTNYSVEYPTVNSFTFHVTR